MSWLYDYIDLGDLEISKAGSDITTDSDDEIIVNKVLAVVVLVVTALLGNCLVIFSVICNKAMRSVLFFLQGIPSGLQKHLYHPNTQCANLNPS